MDNDTQCIFCRLMQDKPALFFPIDGSDLFLGMWDIHPVRPGHALVIPKRHIQHFRDMNVSEMQQIAQAVASLKTQIEQTDLQKLYVELEPLAEHAAVFITKAQQFLQNVEGRKPDGFNDGINDGPAAGQTVPHLHWHIMPRWEGDKQDTKGGIRQMFQGLGNYEKELK